MACESESSKARLKNSRQIGIRLGMAFALLIGIFLGTGHWAARRVLRTDLDVQETLARSTAKLQLAQEVLGYSSENSRITMQLFLLKKTGLIDELLARRAENTKRISKLISDTRDSVRVRPGEATTYSRSAGQDPVRQQLPASAGLASQATQARNGSSGDGRANHTGTLCLPCCGE